MNLILKIVHSDPLTSYPWKRSNIRSICSNFHFSSNLPNFHPSRWILLIILNPSRHNFIPNYSFTVAESPSSAPKTLLLAKNEAATPSFNFALPYIRIAPVAVYKWWRNKSTVNGEKERERGRGGSSGGSKETVSQVDALRKRKSHYRETKVGRLIIIIGVSLRAAARLARGGSAGW